MELIETWNTRGNPDCIVPWGNLYFMCTYNLEMDSKTGCVYLMDQRNELNSLSFDKGILDMKAVGDLLITVSSDGSLDCIDTNRFELTNSLKLSDDCATYISIANDKAYVAFTNGKVSIVDLEGLTLLKESKVNMYEIWSLFATDRIALVPGPEGKLLVYDLSLIHI